MLNNLIENALVYTPACTLITVDLRREGNAVVAVVSDNGPGIPMEEQSSVFQRFYRLEASRSLPGAGLGIPLAAAVADLHHAEVPLADDLPGLAVLIRFPNP